MHGMADGSYSIEDIDALSLKVAKDGVEVAKKISGDAMRLKKHRKKGR